MRILLGNYRYFVSSGSERYLFNVSEALSNRGHDVVPFSVRFAQNSPTPFEKYFVEPPSGPDRVFFRDHDSSLATLKRTTERLFYAPDVERAVVRLVGEQRPTVAYILNYLRKLSPSLLVGLARTRVPIVVRLSDFGMVCPQGHCLRQGAACQLCIHGSLWPSIRHRCVHGSVAISALNAAATWFHRRRRYFDLIDVFVTPSRLLHDVLRDSGIEAHRLRHIPSFVNDEIFKTPDREPQRVYIAYAGRMDPPKGVHVLLEAVEYLLRMQPAVDFVLKLAGTGDPSYVEGLRARAARAGLTDRQVEFVGHLETVALADFMARAKVMVLPSLWYENQPNVLLESIACETPVLVSDAGSLALEVEDGVTGYTFRRGDARHLAERLYHVLQHETEARAIAAHARRVVADRYPIARHVEALEAVFAEVTSH